MSSPRPSSTLSLSTGLAFLAGTVVGSIGLHVLWKRRTHHTIAAAREHLWKIVQYSFTGALLYTGDKLRLYDTLAEVGPVTAKELAKRTSYSERWLVEFLGQATAAGFCDYNPKDQSFTLKTSFALLLQSPERSQDSLAGMFQALNALVGRANATALAIQSGIGVDYDYNKQQDTQYDLIQGIERKNKNWFANNLVTDVIARVTIPSTNESLLSVLERGANVADVGCGCGSSTIALAKRFPNSQFFAYELSPESLRVMRTKVQQEYLTNVTVCNVAETGMDQGPKFDFVYTHDVLHDMTNPQLLIQKVHASLSKRGVWIIVDVDCHGSLHENLSKPSAATSFGFSCLLCLSSSTSEAGGEGLGTLGFHEALARKWMEEAGFAHFSTMKIASLPLNSCFIVG